MLQAAPTLPRVPPRSWQQHRAVQARPEAPDGCPQLHAAPLSARQQAPEHGTSPLKLKQARCRPPLRSRPSIRVLQAVPATLLRCRGQVEHKASGQVPRVLQMRIMCARSSSRRVLELCDDTTGINNKSGQRLGQCSAGSRAPAEAGHPEEPDSLQFRFTFPVYNLMNMMMCTVMMHTGCLPMAAGVLVPMPKGTLLA